MDFIFFLQNGLFARQQQSTTDGDTAASFVAEGNTQKNTTSAAATEVVGGSGEDGGAEKRSATNDCVAGAPASISGPPPAKRAWRDQPHVGKYKLIRTLGSGNFAKVKLAQHITTKKEVGFSFLI